MDLMIYIKPILRWWRLIFVVTALALSVSIVSTMFQPDRYESKTTLVIGTTILDPNPDSGQLMISAQLAQIYADMAMREPVQVATMDALGVDWLPYYQARVVPNSQLLEISVIDTTPERAQIFAGEFANQLILQSPTIGDTQTGGQQDFINQQLASLREQIQETEKNLEELQTSRNGLTSASQIAAVDRDISQENAKLSTLRASYASFLANSQEGAINILTVVEPANLPRSPMASNRLIIVILAGLVGFSLGTGAAYLLEYLDRTIKTASDVERLFNLPVIGYVPEMSENETKPSYIGKNPVSILAENFRLLHSNIEFLGNNRPIKTILITSPSQGNGKTTVASNLALSVSLMEEDVILVDADLRRPAVHKFLKIGRSPGLSDVIKGKESVQGVIRPWKREGNLKVITAGAKQPHVTEVVGSRKISAVLSELKQIHDLVIIDAPPLIISDTYNLASVVDGVIIVIEPGQTSYEQAKTIKEQLDRANATVLGFIFNKMSEESAQSYGDYQYQTLYSSKYYGEYSTKATKEPVTASRSKQLIDFFEHGKVPADVEHAVSAIKTQPRVMLDRIKRPRKIDKTNEVLNTSQETNTDKGKNNNKKAQT